MKGKLIIIEGSDGSGKATQTKKLYDRLEAENYKIKKVEFPNYDSESSALVKMYLRGDFGKSATDVDPYVCSTFYAVDRYASFKTEWEEFYNDGGIIICDIFLDVPAEVSKSLMKDRNNKITGESQKDIHESDFEYLKKSYENSLYIAQKYDWKKINCVENNNMRTIDDIHNEIYSIIEEKILNK